MHHKSNDHINDTKFTIVPLIAPEVLSIPVHENGDTLIDLKNQSDILFGNPPEVPDNQDYTKIRLTVYEKLLEAQRLLPANTRLQLYEGFRSLTLQEKLFSTRYTKLKNTHSNLSHEDLFKEAAKLISPVINLDGSRNIPPHSTGGAIDIYLVDDKRTPIDMGIMVEDWAMDLDGSLSRMNSNRISKAAQSNRQIMINVLSAVGFVNYPAEYWHWSYGDRYWAHHKGMEAAIYGCKA